MSEDELVQTVRTLALHPRRATSAANWPLSRFETFPTFEPAPGTAVEDAKKRFGFPIPNLLERLWREVANGGIGPGYGIYGVEGGMTDEGSYLVLPDLFLEWRESEQWLELVGSGFAERTFPICHWGCGTFSAVDCSTPDGNMLLFVDGIERMDQQVSFARWIADWAEEIEVEADDYSRVRRRSAWQYFAG